MITYQQSGDQLVRYNSASGMTTTIAKYVTGFSVAANPENSSQALIQITVYVPLFHRDLYPDRREPAMIRPRQPRPSKGYSLTVVLIFLILLFALWSTVYRSTSSLLRIETNRVLQQSRDEGAMTALAQALQLLQYSTPSGLDESQPYSIHLRSQRNYLSSTGSCVAASYTVQFTAMPLQGPYRWQVQVTPGSYSRTAARLPGQRRSGHDRDRADGNWQQTKVPEPR